MNEELIATAESAINECSSHLDKFQDSMARRLFPSIYVLLEGDTAPAFPIPLTKLYNDV